MTGQREEHMAERLVAVKSCDICGREDNITQWVLHRTGRAEHVVDLCERHSKPLSEAESASRPARRSSRAVGYDVSTPEELGFKPRK